MSSSLLASMLHPIDSLVAVPADAVAAVLYQPDTRLVQFGVSFFIVLWAIMSFAMPPSGRVRSIQSRLGMSLGGVLLAVMIGWGAEVTQRVAERAVATGQADTLRLLLKAPPEYVGLKRKAGSVALFGVLESAVAPDSAFGRRITEPLQRVGLVEVRTADVPAIERALGVRASDAAALRGMRLAAGR